MEINKEQWVLCSNYLIDNLDFDKIYNNCADISKKNFYKEDIISSIKKIIKEYPNFDTSIKDRIESKTFTLNVIMGYLNDYMYILNTNYSENYGYSWILTIDNLFKIIEKHKKNNSHYFIFNTKEYLRTIKIKKLCQTLNHIK